MNSRNDEKLKKNRWLRALQLARILFDDEGYFTYYLDEIEVFIKSQRFGMNVAIFALDIKNREITKVSDGCCEDCHDCLAFGSNYAALLTIDLTTGHLSYGLDIGSPFPLHHARVIVCVENEQILCKIE